MGTAIWCARAPAWRRIPGPFELQSGATPLPVGARSRDGSGFTRVRRHTRAKPLQNRCLSMWGYSSNDVGENPTSGTIGQGCPGLGGLNASGPAFSEGTSAFVVPGCLGIPPARAERKRMPFGTTHRSSGATASVKDLPAPTGSMSRNGLSNPRIQRVSRVGHRVRARRPDDGWRERTAAVQRNQHHLCHPIPGARRHCSVDSMPGSALPSRHC